MIPTRPFRAIAESIVPEATQLDEAGWAALNGIVARAVSQRPARMQRQLALFIRVLDACSIIRHGRRIDRLPALTRTRFLERVQDSRLLLVRRGFWGIRTLVLMGYYARPEAMPVVGYGANVRGWEVRT